MPANTLSTVCEADSILQTKCRESRHLQFALLGTLLITALIFIAYWPAHNGGFVLDDDLLLTHNSIIQSSNGLYRFWFTREPADYWPVTNSTLWLEWRLWGMNPTGYHITNFVLHVVDSLLLWLVLSRLKIPGAFLAALLFAVHPVNVESVAWIAQRKNVLALLFFLLSILYWLKTIPSEQDRTVKNHKPVIFRSWYWLSFIAFLFAMLSKGSVAILPFVLLLITWWQSKRINSSNILHCAPFFAAAFVLALIDIWFQRQGSGEIIRDISFGQRLLGASATVWFYLGKALAPMPLSFVYPQWNIDVGNLLWWLPLLGGGVITVALMWLQTLSLKQWTRPLLFAWIFFCIALLPVMGFTDVGFMRHSLVADHYQHIAIIAVVTLIAAIISVIANQFQSYLRHGISVSTGAIVLLLALLTHQQSSLYASPLVLYQDTVRENPASWLAHNNLGNALVDVGRKQDALTEFQQTVELNPKSSVAHNNLGIRLADAGQFQDAIDHFQQALKYQTNYADAYNNLGMALVNLGRSQEAAQQLKLAVKYQTDFAEAHNNLGTIYLHSGHLEDAVLEFQDALKTKTDYFEARNNLAVVLAKSGLFAEAIEQYESALNLKPDSAETHNNLGNALAQVGRTNEAIDHYQRALKLRPDYVQAYVNLAMTQAADGQKADAITTAQSALELAKLQNQTLLSAQLDSWLKAHRSDSTER